MRHRIATTGLLMVTALATGAPAAVSSGRAATQPLLLDAIIRQERTVGPPAGQPGRRQIARGVLRSDTGRRLGHFAFTCTHLDTRAGGGRERCDASAWLPKGRFDATGPSQAASTLHHWRITGGSGVFQGARGSLLVRDLNDHESLISAAVIARSGVVLRDGRLRLPGENRVFRAKADARCGTAASRLATLPAFPFTGFDPLHPDPALLPRVGAFFTGPGDPRPALRSLLSALHALGRPPADEGAWSALLAARRAELSIIAQQDRAALAGDAAAFVRSVRASSAGFRVVAITATVFGVERCVL